MNFVNDSFYQIFTRNDFTDCTHTCILCKKYTSTEPYNVRVQCMSNILLVNKIY